jgi:hypothetical protein
LVVALLVDFQIDHSLPWIISVAYIICVLARNSDLDIGFQVKNKNAYRYVLGLSLLGVMAVTVNYFNQVKDVELLANKERVASFISSRYLDFMALVDKDIGLDLHYRFKNQKKHGAVTTSVNLTKDACLYQHLNAALVYRQGAIAAAVDRQPLIFQGINNSFAYSNTAALNCANYSYPTYKKFTDATFVSDASYFINRNELKYWPLYININMYSALFALPSGAYSFSFSAKGQFGLGKWPKYEVSLFRMNDEEPLKIKVIEISHAKDQSYQFSFNIDKESPNAPYYLKMSYTNEARDSALKQDRNIFINPKSFTIQNRTEKIFKRATTNQTP